VARELTMPKLSDSMEEATIVRWLKRPGERFARGEPLAEIETDKATVVYEAESDGVLATIVVPEGGAARLGEPIALLDGDADATAAPVARTPQAPTSTAPPTVTAPTPTAAHRDPGRPRATPVARRRAVELGVALFGLAGTGPGGRITRVDVERAAASLGAVADAGYDKGAVERIELTPTQATIARRMTAAASVPTFAVTAEIDMTTVVALRRGAGDLVQRMPSVNDFVVRAAALALRRFPAFNSAYADGAIERHARVNVGIAVALEGALLVPTLFDADRKPLVQISAETRELVERARRRALRPEELTQSTFTVSNLGMFSVHSFTAIVDPPQAAILAVGGIARRPQETDDGQVAFRDTLLATLTADHRVVYGADGAAFLAHVKDLLEHPLSLLL